MIYDGFYTFQVVSRISAINSLKLTNNPAKLDRQWVLPLKSYRNWPNRKLEDRLPVPSIFQWTCYLSWGVIIQKNTTPPSTIHHCTRNLHPLPHYACHDARLQILQVSCLKAMVFIRWNPAGENSNFPHPKIRKMLRYLPSLKLTARPWKSPCFLVNTIKMVDSPWLC